MGLGIGSSKVARVIDKYDLDGMGERLESEWTGERGERTSLRDLADEFNRAILESVIEEADGFVLSIDVDGIYRALTDTDIPEATRIRQRRTLEREGIDVEDVLDDFVTHQTIHTFLTEHRNAELDDYADDIAERKIQVIDRLLGRVSAVSESSLDTLINADEVTEREYSVLATVEVVCSACGTSHRIIPLIEQGGCSCSEVDADDH